MIHQVPDIIAIHIEENKKGTNVYVRFAKKNRRYHLYTITEYKENANRVEMLLKRS